MQFWTEKQRALVSARLACDGCLRAPSSIRVVGGPGAREAVCECGHCGQNHRIVLTAYEAASLWRATPRLAHISYAPEAI
jgi:hypothetical protein